jgi:hypothetical protein
MYLTAHRVWSRIEAQEAIHAFYYRHGATPQKVDWNSPDIARIADAEPGELIASQVVLPPGGNEVKSYLDVAAPDATPVTQVEAAVATFETDVTSSTSATVTALVDGVALRFYARSSAISSKREEFAALWAEARKLYEHPSPSAPLVVKVEETPEGELRLHLDEASGDRVRAVLGADWAVPRILVEADAVRLFADLRGSWLGALIPVLAGLDADRVAALGGIRFERTRDGATLWSL